MESQETTFEAVRERLDEIVEEVGAEGISLDEALALYEEAVKLGLSACDLSEQDALAAADAVGAGVPTDAATNAAGAAADANAEADVAAASPSQAPEGTDLQ